MALVTISLLAVYHLHPADVGEYSRYARAALNHPLLHQWPHEYPVFSLFIFLLPLLLPFSYALAFGLWAGAAWIAILAVRAHSAWRNRMMVYTGLGGLAVLTGRFDIFAVGCSVIGIEMARQERWQGAWLWLILGLLTKLYPAIYLPIIFIAEWRQKKSPPIGRALLWLSLTGALLGAQSLLAGSQTLSPYAYFSNRPLEIGSFPANLAAILHPKSFHIVFGFGSMNVLTVSNSTLSAIFGIFLIVGLLGVYWAMYRGKLATVGGALLSLTILLLTSKVFSVQFLLWLIPLWSYFPWNPWWMLSAILSSAAYPFAYNFASTHTQWWFFAIALYTLRSITLIAGTVTAGYTTIEPHDFSPRKIPRPIG